MASHQSYSMMEEFSRDIDGYHPAMAYYEAALIFGTGPNRAPEDFQVPLE